MDGKDDDDDDDDDKNEKTSAAVEQFATHVLPVKQPSEESSDASDHG